MNSTMTTAFTSLPNVGMTPCVTVPELADIFGCAEVWIKDETHNPFGTYKDRRSSYITQKALAAGVDALALITAGNAGYSLRQFCTPANIDVYHIVDMEVSQSVIARLSGPQSHVIRYDLNESPLSSDDIIRIAQNAPHEVVWDVSNGSHEAYHSLFNELYSLEPDVIVVPFGSGETFHGLTDIIMQQELPIQVIGIGVQNLRQSTADKLCAIWTPYLSLNHRIEEQGHRLIRLSEPQVADAYDMAQDFMACEASSAVVFAAKHFLSLRGDERVVLINSGQGIKSESQYPSHRRTINRLDGPLVST